MAFRLNDTKAKVDELEAEIQRRSPQLGQLRATVATLQRRIKEVGGPTLARTQAKVRYSVLCHFIPILSHLIPAHSI